MTVTGRSSRQKERSGVRPVTLLEQWLAGSSLHWKAVYRNNGNSPSLLSRWSHLDNSTLRTLDMDLYEYCGNCEQMLLAFEIKGAHERDRYWTRTRNYASKLGSWSALAVEYPQSGTVTLAMCSPKGKIYPEETYDCGRFLASLEKLERLHQDETGCGK